MQQSTGKQQNAMSQQGQQIDAQSAQQLGAWAIKTVQGIATSGGAVVERNTQDTEQLGRQLYGAVKSYETTGKFTGSSAGSGSGVTSSSS